MALRAVLESTEPPIMGDSGAEEGLLVPLPVLLPPRFRCVSAWCSCSLASCPGLLRLNEATPVSDSAPDSASEWSASSVARIRSAW